jgi:hypothetical protein
MAVWFRAGQESFRLQDSSGVGGEPKKTEDSRVQSWGRGAQIVEGEQSFGDAGDFGEVEGRGGSVADGDDGSGVQSGRGYKIVMRGRRIGGSSKRAGVDNRALKNAS